MSPEVCRSDGRRTPTRPPGWHECMLARGWEPVSVPAFRSYLRGNRLTNGVHSLTGYWKINAVALGGWGFLASLVSASAEETRSPEDLRVRVTSAILSGNSDQITALFHSESDSELVQNLVYRFQAFKGSELNVKAVGKQDDDWPSHQSKTPASLEGTLQSFPELAFPVEPLGRISVSGTKPGEPTGCKVSVLYGKFGEKYFMMLANDKSGRMIPLPFREGPFAPRC